MEVEYLGYVQGLPLEASQPARPSTKYCSHGSNPGNPVMSPHARHLGTRHTDKPWKYGREWGGGGGTKAHLYKHGRKWLTKCPMNNCHVLKRLNEHVPLPNTADCSLMIDRPRPPLLFVVNFVKLHLIVINALNTHKVLQCTVFTCV